MEETRRTRRSLAPRATSEVKSLTRSRSLSPPRRNADGSGRDGIENIRVICRFRPQNDDEMAHGGENCIKQLNENSVMVVEDTFSNKNHIFSFTNVFNEQSTQEEFYNYSAAPMVADVMDGYSAAIIAYGQTGAGKTYTMQGPGFDDPYLNLEGLNEGLKGITPRVVEDIFRQIDLAPEGVSYEISASYLEIYLEKVRDLLNPHPDERHSLLIQETGTSGLLTVPGALAIAIYSTSQIISLMRRGAMNRVVAYTESNEESSRSHAIFLITIKKTDSIHKVTKSSQLYLVDLAGSEKVAKTKAQGTRLSEAMDINKSLLSLGNVIVALVDQSISGKKRHIPYRNSKLTRLLKNSLGGNAKTTLIINCSPSSYNVRETISTLRFGDKTSKIQNKPVVNEVRTVEELEKLLKGEKEKCGKQEEEINELKKEMEELREMLKVYQLSLNLGDDETEALKNKISQNKNNVINLETDQQQQQIEHNEENKIVAHHIHSDIEVKNSVSTATTSSNRSTIVSASVADSGARDRMLNRKKEMMCFLCPISRRPFSEPVVAWDGYTYERSVIEKWMQTRNKSPLTGRTLGSKHLIPNYNMKNQLRLKKELATNLVLSVFDLLPDELLLYIFLYLDARSLQRCLKVCKCWNEVGNDEELWKGLVMRDVGKLEKKLEVTYKSFYMATFAHRRKSKVFLPSTLIRNKVSLLPT